MRKTVKLFFLLLLFVGSKMASQTIRINEIMASNESVYADEDGDYQDWIELYNTTEEQLDITGYGLSDDPTLPYKWVFPGILLEPGQYLVIFCSDKNRTDPTLPLHTNFKISAGGETITLTHPSGLTEDTVPAVAIATGFSYGRTVPFPSFGFFAIPTPGAENISQAYSEILSDPEFSVASGIYSAPFNLSIAYSDAEATILYTLDGSEPRPENLGGTTYSYKNSYAELPGDTSGDLMQNTFTTLQYVQPLEISDRSNVPNKIASIATTFNNIPYYIPSNPIAKSTVVKAIAYKNGALSGKPVTKNYFYSETGSSAYTLPVVAVNIDENLMFDYDRGLHVAGKKFDDWRAANPDGNSQLSDNNYLLSGDESEVKGSFSYYVGGVEKVSQNVGVRLHGNFTRIFPNKSLRIYARSEYGNSSLDFPFFNDRPFDSYKTIILRNSGNDVNLTYFRDAFIQRTNANLHVVTQAYQPTITFLNGEYWGLLNLRERYDKHYFKRVYGVDTDALDFLEFNGFIVQEGDYNHYAALLGYLDVNDLADDANYNYVATQLDPENFTDFFIANIYAANTDWPQNNIEFWRKKTTAYEPDAPYGQDGRWRWVLKDMDFGFGYESGNATYEHNTLAYASSTGGDIETNPEWSTFLFRKLLENEKFKTNFINRFADVMNTTYLPERVDDIIAEMKAAIEPEILQHGQRWQSFLTLSDWENHINTMVEFADRRQEFQRNNIREKFGIAQNIDVTLNVSDNAAGYVNLNTIAIKEGTDGIGANPYPWSGVYFSNIPVTLKAVANNGYTFGHWEGTSESTSPEITLTEAESFEVTAVFIASEPEIVRAPVYFWMMDGSMPNNLPLQSINSTFEANGVNASVQYESCLIGYPFAEGDPNWRKASMERRNSPTAINYIPEANNGILFANSDMKALQIKEPLHSNGLENTLVFNLSTLGYENVKFTFAAFNELTNATAITLEYAVNQGSPVWITDGLAASSFPLSDAYQLFAVDFSEILAVNDNPDFRIRVRFTGTNMETDAGNRITFNNVAVLATQTQLDANAFSTSKFSVYPNPFSDVVNVSGIKNADYKVFSVDGKLIQNGKVSAAGISLHGLNKGLYLLQFTTAEGHTETKKIVKK